MNFVSPAFLFAFAALAIPVIIHFFNFRRYKTIYFPSVTFLKEVKEETTSRNKVKHLLVLLSRLLAIAFLVLAFAQPFISNKNQTARSSGRNISIYVDNSFSMGSSRNGVPLLEIAKQKATELVKSYSPADHFQIITSDMEGHQQHLLTADEALREIDEVKISPAAASLQNIIAKQNSAMANVTESKLAFMLSDFQQWQLDADETATIDTGINRFALLLDADELQNVSIDSCWLDAPAQTINQKIYLLARIINNGTTDAVSRRVTLKINDQLKYIGNVSVPAESTVIDTISFTLNTTGWNKCELNINDSPVNFDDTYYFCFNVLQQVNVTCINQQEENSYVNALFKNDAHFRLLNMSIQQIDYTGFAGENAIILNGVKEISTGLSAELQRYVNNGGSLIIFPSADVSLSSYASFLSLLKAKPLKTLVTTQQAVTAINTQQEIFKDVFTGRNENMDLPVANKYFSFEPLTGSAEEKLLLLKDGNSLISKYTTGKGNLYVSAVALDKEMSSLPLKSIFVPMLVKMVFSSIKLDKPAYTLGDNNNIAIPGTFTETENAVRLKNKKQEFIPSQSIIANTLYLQVSNQLKDAGIYELQQTGDNKPALAFNFNRKESALRFYKEADLENKLSARNIKLITASEKNMASLVSDINQGTVLWKWCVILALLFLLAEVLLLRFWKK